MWAACIKIHQFNFSNLILTFEIGLRLNSEKLHKKMTPSTIFVKMDNPSFAVLKMRKLD